MAETVFEEAHLLTIERRGFHVLRLVLDRKLKKQRFWERFSRSLIGYTKIRFDNYGVMCHRHNFYLLYMYWKVVVPIKKTSK